MENLPGEMIDEIMIHLDYQKISALYQTSRMFWRLKGTQYIEYKTRCQSDYNIYIPGIYVVIQRRRYPTGGGWGDFETYRYISGTYDDIKAKYIDLILEENKCLSQDFAGPEIYNCTLLHGNKILDSAEYNYAHIPFSKCFYINNNNNDDRKDCEIKYPLYDIRMIRYYDTERSLGLYDNEHDAMSKYNSKIKNLDEYEEKISVVKILNEKLEEENITEYINPKSFGNDFGDHYQAFVKL